MRCRADAYAVADRLQPAAVCLSVRRTAAGNHRTGDLTGSDHCSACNRCATTAVPVTQAPATEKPTDAPKTEQSSQQNSPKATSEKTLGGARLVETPDYTDDVLGVTFHMPEWQNRVYAKTDNYDGKYSLTFYEGSNLARGLEDGYDGMGMLFTLYEDSAQASGDITYPVGTIEIGGEKVYLTYFKPTDVRFYPEGSLQENYQEMYKHQREYFETGVFRSAMHYQPSAATYAVNLTSE